MAEDLLTVLTRFHREVVIPDMERLIDDRFTPLRDEMLSGFDAVYKRLDRLESEYQSLRAAVQRLEDGLTVVGQKIDKMALRSELVELKSRVALLEQKIAEIEANL